MAKATQKPVTKIVRLPHGDGLPPPAYQSAEAAGLDLIAAVPVTKPVKLKPHERALIPTGLCFELPKGYEGQVRPRSGLALKHGVTVLNTPGTIDSDYRGEVQVLLINLGSATFTVQRGERIAQLVVAPVVQTDIKFTKTLKNTSRGAGGFGSTGAGKSSSRRGQKARPKIKVKSKKSPSQRGRQTKSKRSARKNKS